MFIKQRLLLTRPGRASVREGEREGEREREEREREGEEGRVASNLNWIS